LGFFAIGRLIDTKQYRSLREDARDLIHYYRLTKDNRIVMGGGDVSLTYGTDLDADLNEKTFAHLKNHVTQIFPQLAGIGFTHQWGGPVSVTLDMAPAFGYRRKTLPWPAEPLAFGLSQTLRGFMKLEDRLYYG